MRLISLAVTLALGLVASVPCRAADADTPAEKRREARKVHRKVKQKSEEAANIAKTFRDNTKIPPEAEAVAAKINDGGVPSRRLEASRARRFRELFKLTEEKLLKEKDLRAITEAEERRARAREETQQNEQALKHKRKIDLTIFFDW